MKHKLALASAGQVSSGTTDSGDQDSFKKIQSCDQIASPDDRPVQIANGPIRDLCNALAQARDESAATAAAQRLYDFTLSRKHRAEALAAFAEVWTQVPASIRLRVAGDLGSATVLLTHAHSFAFSPGAELRLNAVRMICETASLPGAPYLLGLLNDPDEIVRHAAAEAFVEFAQVAASKPGERAAFELVLARAVDSIGIHGQSAVLRALVIDAGEIQSLASARPELLSVIDGDEDREASVFTDCLKANSELIPPRSALVWSRLNGCARVAMGSALTQASTQIGVYENSHLLLHPAREEALLRHLEVHTPDRGVAIARDAARIAGSHHPVAAARFLLQLDRCAMVSPAFESVVLSCFGSGSPWLRFAALRHAAQRASVCGVATVRDLCFDADPAIAASAARAWCSPRLRRAAGAQTYRDVALRFQRSAHPAVRAIAPAARPATPLFDVFRSSPEDPQQRLAARKWLKRDRSNAIAALRSMLTTPDEASSQAEDRHAPPQRDDPVILALAWCRALELAEPLCGSITHIIDEGHSAPAGTRLAWYAAWACNTLRTAHAPSEANPCIIRALRAVDPRVRANAAEALLARSIRMSIPFPAQLLELASGGDHRSKSTAAMACLCWGHAAPDDLLLAHQATGLQMLTSLLRSNDPASVVAGLWATEQCVRGESVSSPALWQTISAALDSVDRLGIDPVVLVRKREVARQISTRVRLGWAGRVTAWGESGSADW